MVGMRGRFVILLLFVMGFSLYLVSVQRILFYFGGMRVGVGAYGLGGEYLYWMFERPPPTQ